jgi:aminomuconate-semialdehyde/2-hydroxymuconate-6-semialdehyde dehydrogenase
MIEIKNYVDGKLSSTVLGGTLPNYEPHTGRIFGSIPASSEEDVNIAVIAAKKAFPSWSRSSNEFRFRILNKIADLIDERLEMLAEAESRDNGKPLSLSLKVDIPRASTNFRFFATAAMQFASESHAMPGVAINYTLRQAIGVVGCISPWNLPLYLFTWKIAPALAAGNTVVAKPSELTPYTAFLLSQICIDAGLPDGVLNIVHGTGRECGQAIVAHPLIKAISFTGGTVTGRHIAAVTAPVFKKLSLELGGKNATVVFEDANLESAVNTAVAASFSNQGQICLCGSRILVHRKVYEAFMAEFIKRVATKKVGNPFDPDTEIGALVSEAHLHKVKSYISLAVEEGGSIVFGGEQVILEGDCSGGWYLQPTVIAGLTQECRTNQEEIFGPVVTVQPFESDEEVLEMINQSRYGLACSIWTKDIQRATLFAEQVETGIVWINCWLLRDLRTPFGGVKESGVGREGGWEAMRFFTEPKNVCIKYK